MNKYIYIIIGVIILILLACVIYRCFSTKQNFQVDKRMNTFKIQNKIKNNLKSIVEDERKKLKEKLLKKLQKKGKTRALRNLSSEDNTDEDGVPKNPEDLPVVFKNAIGQSPIGKAVYLRKCNFLKPKEVLENAKYYIFKKQLPVGKIDPTTGLRKIIDSQSFENELITKTLLGKQVTSSLDEYSKTEQLIEKLSTEISGSVGGSYGKLSVNASFNYLTSTDSDTKSNYQSSNLTIEKTSGTFMYDPEFYYREENYNQQFLDDFIYLAGQNPQNLGTDNPYEIFFDKYGTHFISSIDIGKKISNWITIQSDESNTTNLLSMKACLSVSFGDYQACRKTRTGPGCPENQCKENYEDGDIDWDEPVDWEPNPVPGTEDLPDETTTTPSNTTSKTPSKDTTTASPTITTTTTTPQPTPQGYECKVSDEECPSGQYCKDYQFPEYDKCNKIAGEMMGKCYNKGAAGFSIGANVCAKKTESTTDIDKITNSTNRLDIYGGSDETQAQLAAGVGGKLSEPIIVNFLTSEDYQDVPINYQFTYIWEPFIQIYSKLKDNTNVQNNYVFKIGKIITGCKQIVNLNIKDNRYINDILSKYKFNNEYETIICCANTTSTSNYLKNQQKVNLISTPPKIYTESIEENDYYIYDINKLLPKIILDNIEATIEQYPEAQVKGKKLFLLINKYDKNDIRIELIPSDNDSGSSTFTIKNVVPINNTYINKSDNEYYDFLNFKIIFNTTCDSYNIELTNALFTFQNVLKYYFTEYHGNISSSIEFDIPCMKDYGIDGRSITDYTLCNRMGDVLELEGKKYYNYVYTDEELKKNYIELCVSDSAVLKYYNPEKMWKAATNIRTAFIYKVVCPQFEKETLTNQIYQQSNCGNIVPGTVICRKGFITGISSGYGRDTDSIGIKCSSGENYGYGNNNGGFGGEKNGPKTQPKPEGYLFYKEIPSDTGFRKFASNHGWVLNNLNVYNDKLEHKGMFGNGYGNDYGEGVCPEGQLLVGFNLRKGCEYDVLTSIQGICRPQPPVSEGVTCDV